MLLSRDRGTCPEEIDVHYAVSNLIAIWICKIARDLRMGYQGLAK